MLDNETLQRYFYDLEQQSLYSGVVRITQGESECFAGAYGYASRPWQIRNTLDTRFDTASVTKLFTAAATLQLIEQGHFALDTGVMDFLELAGTTISKDVTPFHLLTHTSGIGDDCDEEAGEVYEDLWKTKPNYSVLETADFLPQFIHRAPNFPSGQGCRYCNCSFILLGLMIEKVTGLSYRDYVRRHVFAPAGMTHSDFFRMDRVHPNVAEGADPLRDESGAIVAWKKNIYSYPPIGSPDSGAHVTAADLDRFLRALQSGKLLSPEMTTLFFTPQVPYGERETWHRRQGIVFWYYVDKASDQVVFYEKEGINAGASAVMRYYPEHDLSVVLLSNMEEGVWEPVWKIHEMLVTAPESVIQ